MRDRPERLEVARGVARRAEVEAAEPAPGVLLELRFDPSEPLEVVHVELVIGPGEGGERLGGRPVAEGGVRHRHEHERVEQVGPEEAARPGDGCPPVVADGDDPLGSDRLRQPHVVGYEPHHAVLLDLTRV